MRLNHRHTILPPPNICVIGYGIRGWGKGARVKNSVRSWPGV